ncbi:MAG: N-acetylmuramoyl-L-alanine amidase [Bacteroides sp.]|nr:N-acetylmuramoyl-L-alanine amidase [Bacteroides sp.]MCM1086312.1 N-acetylmuramoyl-L-alanine amidase [Bacteroides sp.]
MRTVKYIAVHCTATRQQSTSIAGLKAHWASLGWKKPGYHYVVMPSGKVERLLDESEVSNGVKGFNACLINVAYAGGIDDSGKATDNRTEAQKAALYFLLEQLRERYPQAVIQGHRDFSPDLDGNGIITSDEYLKECPCFDARAEYGGI